MRLWQLQYNNIVISRVVESESPKSDVCSRVGVLSLNLMKSRLGVGFIDLVELKSESLLLLETSLYAKLIYICIFYLYIYPLDSQEKNLGDILRASNYSDLLFRRYLNTAVLLKFLCLFS